MENTNDVQGTTNVGNDVMARLFDDVVKSTNADKDRVVCGYNKGKLCFYELDLHEERVKRYLTTISLNVL
jgi:hypothetical protein